MPPYKGNRGEEVTLEAGDIEIGAVEVKDGTTDTRAVVATTTPAVAAAGLAVRETPTAGTESDAADITVDATAGGVTLLAANAARKSALIENTGAAAMRVRIAGDPTTTRGHYVAAGGLLVLAQPFCPTGAIKAIRATGTSTTAYPTEVV